MAKLTAAGRKALPAKTFAGPGRSFPIPDKSHARAALSGATRAVHAGHISAATANKIRARANKMLGKTAAEDGAR